MKTTRACWEAIATSVPPTRQRQRIRKTMVATKAKISPIVTPRSATIKCLLPRSRTSLAETSGSSHFSSRKKSQQKLLSHRRGIQISGASSKS